MVPCKKHGVSDAGSLLPAPKFSDPASPTALPARTPWASTLRTLVPRQVGSSLFPGLPSGVGREPRYLGSGDPTACLGGLASGSVRAVIRTQETKSPDRQGAADPKGLFWKWKPFSLHSYHDTLILPGVNCCLSRKGTRGQIYNTHSVPSHIKLLRETPAQWLQQTELSCPMLTRLK